MTSNTTPSPDDDFNPTPIKRATTLSYPGDDRLSGEDTIRILHLNPGAFDDEMECNTETVSLSNDPVYEAISYAWGNQLSTKRITTNGLPVDITTTLFNALRRMRLPEHSRALWIDQLCISQWDLDEKANQVMLMRRIYENCTQCLLWFGEVGNEAGLEEKHEHDSDDGTIDKKGPRFTVEDAKMALRGICELGSANQSHKLQKVPEMLQNNNAGKAARQAFLALSARENPWWSRIWTVQEAALPPSATLMWGPLVISWQLVEKAAQNCVNSRTCYSPKVASALWAYDGTECFNPGPLFAMVMGVKFSKGSRSALDLLVRWRPRGATDARDKVYALLGLVRQDELLSCRTCDYSIEPGELYAKVTVDIVLQEQTLSPLVGFRCSPRRTPDLPSWAIDFIEPVASIGDLPYEWWSHFLTYRNFNAADALESDISFHRLEAGHVLRVKGQFVDEITKVGEVLGTDTFPVLLDGRLKHGQLTRVIRDWYKLVLTSDVYCVPWSKYVGGGSVYDAFWRTLVWNSIRKQQSHGYTACPDDARESFEAYMGDWQSRSPIVATLTEFVFNQTFFITKKGYIGLGSPKTKVGNQVWILGGGRMPFLLKPDTSRQNPPSAVNMAFIGEAYVDGIMQGEAVKVEPTVTVDIW